MDGETRAYLDEALGSLRQAFGELGREFGQLRGEFGGLRGEFVGLGQEFGGLRQEFVGLGEELGGLRQEFGGLRQELQDATVETRRHFDVVAESLRRDIRSVAEGVAATTERIDRVEVSVKTEMEERFAATHSVFRAAFQELRRDIDDVRSRL